jgi:hypothetical protein
MPQTVPAETAVSANVPAPTDVSEETATATVDATPTEVATAIALADAPQPAAETAVTLPIGGLLTSAPNSVEGYSFKSPGVGVNAVPPRKQSGVAADEQSTFLILFPELRSAPAPNWLKEGVRLTYRVESANVAQKEGVKGSTGAGYAQYDLVALDKASAVTAVRFYTDLGNDTLLPSLVMRFVGLPGAGEYWLNPKVLPRAERVANDNLTVIHTPHRLGNKTYKAVRFQYTTDGAEYVWVFEEATGLLLFYRHAIGKDTDDTRQLTQITFVRQRQIKLPWRGTAPPDWAIEGAQLTYKGSYAVSIPGSPDTALPYRAVARVTQQEPRWTEFTLETKMQSAIATDRSVRATGVAQLFNGLWLPAEALDVLEDGQVLDRDPTTGAEIRVSRGNGAITLTEAGASYTTVLTYDEKDGVLLNMREETQNGVGTVRVDLALTARP